MDHGVLGKKLIKLFAQIAADNIELIKPGCKAGIKEAVNKTNAVNANERFRCVERNRGKTGAQTGGQKHSAFHAVGFECLKACVCKDAIFYQLPIRQIFQNTGNGICGAAGFCLSRPLMSKVPDTARDSSTSNSFLVRFMGTSRGNQSK